MRLNRTWNTVNTKWSGVQYTKKLIMGKGYYANSSPKIIDTQGSTSWSQPKLSIIQYQTCSHKNTHTHTHMNWLTWHHNVSTPALYLCKKKKKVMLPWRPTTKNNHSRRGSKDWNHHWLDMQFWIPEWQEREMNQKEENNFF